MTRKANKQEKQVETKKEKGKASEIKSKAISKKKEKMETRENKPKASKSKKAPGTLVFKKAPIRSPVKASAGTKSPTRKYEKASQLADEVMYQPTKKEATVPRHKASRVAARQLKAPVEQPETKVQNQKESPADKLKADERMLFGSVADQKPPYNKPVSSSAESQKKEQEELERAKRLSLALFKEPGKKRSTNASRISLSPNTSRLSQISYVAAKTQMTQPKLAEEPLDQILKKYRLNLKSGKREWDAKAKELVEFYDKNLTTSTKELKEAIKGKKESKHEKSPTNKSDKSSKSKKKENETKSSKDAKSTNSTSSRMKKVKK